MPRDIDLRVNVTLISMILLFYLKQNEIFKFGGTDSKTVI
jgi:hypothetical protein